MAFVTINSIQLDLKERCFVVSETCLAAIQNCGSPFSLSGLERPFAVSPRLLTYSATRSNVCEQKVYAFLWADILSQQEIIT